MPPANSLNVYLPHSTQIKPLLRESDRYKTGNCITVTRRLQGARGKQEGGVASMSLAQNISCQSIQPHSDAPPQHY